MKKFIAIIAFLIVSLSAYSQIDYPRIEKDSLGNKVVVMTIEQAQKLDNNSELLVLFEKLDSQIGNFDSICIKVLNEKDVVINTQIVQINDLKRSLQTKDAKISNLQSQIEEKDKKLANKDTEIANKDKEINLHLDEIKRVKRKYLVGGSIGGAILGFVLGVILSH